MNNKQTNIVNWRSALHAAKADPAVGIKIAPLNQNVYFGMYVAEVLPNKKVGAHFHQEGIETYSILLGEGVLHTATPNQNNDPMHVKSESVSEGDFFDINPGIIHQLENTGTVPLILIFGCPSSHLDLDRIITKDLV